MKPLNLIRQQLKQISTFIIILVLLFIFTIAFHLNYDWHGMSIIVKVYMVVFSFLLIFNISQIDIPKLKKLYRKMYKKKGIYILFLTTRVLPILFIYLCVIIFTLIDNINDIHWPTSSLFELLGGKNSNIVFISLILLLILKLHKKPSITIPIFISVSILHFIIYKSIYTVFPIGISVTAIKMFEFFIFLFFLIYEFNADKLKIIKTTLYSLIIGSFLYIILISTYYMIFTYSEFSSYKQVRSSLILFKMGYSFPMEKFSDIVFSNNRYDLVDDLISNAKQYHYKLDATVRDWEKLFKLSSLNSADNLCKYLMKQKIPLSYSVIMDFVEHHSINSHEDLARLKYLTRCMSFYVEENYDDIIERFKNGNITFKLWLIDVLSESRYYESIPFLISLLTDIDYRLTVQAYIALTKITGIDPVSSLKVQQNNPQTIDAFLRIYREKGISH